MQAVILGAGSGRRLRRLSTCKPLTKLFGLPLLERNIRLLENLGVSKIVVVSGHQRERLERWCRHHAPRLGVELVTVYNDEWNVAENGRSLLSASGHVDESFLLLMADHVYSSELLASLAEFPPPSGGAVLAVDRDVIGAPVDPDDVTRVRLRGRDVVVVAKGLDRPDGFDTGAFHCDPGIFEMVEESVRAGASRLSQAMQRLAAVRRLKACFVDGMFWHDVDTPEEYRIVRRRLLDQVAAKPTDGPVSRYLNRPLSRRLTPLFVAAGMRPNTISVLAFLLALAAAGLLAQPEYALMALGGVIAQLSSVIDGCDGEVARLTLRTSRFGGWFDAQLDRYADAALLGALTWNVVAGGGGFGGFAIGLAAIAGSFVVSYGAHKADRLIEERFRVGRDLRVLVIMLSALFGSAWPALIVIAVTMNIVVVRRMVAMRPVLDPPLTVPESATAGRKTVPPAA